ncbi:MAG: hypothetical protein IKZ56_13425 [Bacteroidales bacterium]|nr:hypothetical protein [Bacteroidales bacterium]MBR5922153.1 hypothetical protein [Bacteroidales bacterium]
MELIKNQDNKPQRTFVLWFLAICTMINAGMNVMSFSLYAFFPGLIRQSMDFIQNIPMFSGDEYKEIFDIFLSVTPQQYLLLILAEIASFAGALIMLWKMKSIGFHIYTIAQIFEFCILNFLIGGKMAMNLSAVVMTVLIIILFATQLRYMQGDRAADTDSPTDNPQNDNNE